MRNVIQGLAGGVIALLTATSSSEAWSGGPVLNVTDVEAKCAVCHSSATREQLRTESAGIQNFMVVENRHYKAIQDGTGAYANIQPADRQRLLADVKAVDEAASVMVIVPESVRPGQEVQITATVRGGNEIVGVALVDSDLRMQGRSIHGDGWLVIGPPKVWGSDGKEQTKWVDARAAGLRKNINSAVVFDQKADIGAKRFAGGKATWTVRAPQEPGTYTVAAVMFYGTEKASPVGSVTTPGGVQPRGGSFGNSGRIVFSKPVTVTVR
jgi:hypothetical protein